MLIINACYFGYVNHSSYIRADQWRFLDLYLKPIYSETFTYKNLWLDKHPTPFTGLLFIASEHFFELTVNLYFYAGMLGKILFFLLLSNVLSKNVQSQGVKYIVLILTATTWFSLKNTIEYSWPLVTLSNFWIFFLLLNLVLLDLSFRSSDRNYKYQVLLLLSFLILLVGTRDLTLIYIASTIPILVIISVIHSDYKNLIVTTLIALFSIFFYIIFQNTLDINQFINTSTDKNFDLDSFHLLGIIRSFSVAILSGFVSLKGLKTAGFSENNIYFLSYITCSFYLITGIIYFKNSHYKTSIIPLTLMSFSVIFATAVILFRYFPMTNEASWWVAAGRYIKIYEIGSIGWLWALFMILDQYYKKTHFRACLVVSIFYMFLNAHYIKEAWDSSKYILNYHSRVEQALLSIKSKEKLPNFRFGNSFSYEKVLFLKEKKMNVFSEKYVITEQKHYKRK